MLILRSVLPSLMYIMAICCFPKLSFAQCIANAGNDTSLCVNFGFEPYTLGGIPTVEGGTEPYTFAWTCTYTFGPLIYTEVYYLDNPNTENPKIINSGSDSLIFYLTVTDAEGNMCADTVEINFCSYVWTADVKFAYIHPGDTTNIGPSVAGNCGPLTFEWSPDYNISDINTESPLVWPEINTQYVSTVTDAAGCVAGGGTFYVYVIPVSINNPEQTIKFQIAPNPLTDNSTITIDNANQQVYTINFYDAFGRAIKNITLVDTKTALSKSDFATGIYFYEVLRDDTVMLNGKLCVQ